MVGIHPKRPLVLVRDDDPLLCWSIEQHLGDRYCVRRCADFDALRSALPDPALVSIIIGADGHDDELRALPRLIEPRAIRLIALVAAADQTVPDVMLRLDKPFALSALNRALGS